MSNIHGKHVQSVKTWRNLIRGIVFSTNTASVTDVFEIIALNKETTVYLAALVYLAGIFREFRTDTQT